MRRQSLAKAAPLILFVHGDTGPYCLQGSYLGAGNMTRLNGSGDYRPGATEVTYSAGIFHLSIWARGKVLRPSAAVKGIAEQESDFGPRLHHS